MKIIERMKNIFAKPKMLPENFLRDPEYDIVFWYDTFGSAPDIVKARNGRRYVYFENVDPEKLDIARKMGFRLHSHKSHKYKPAKRIYRALITRDLSDDALTFLWRMKGMLSLSSLDLPTESNKHKNDPKYLKYIAVYKSNQKTK